MFRLIINTKSEFDAVFCEQLVQYFGKLEIIPYSNQYCLVQGIEIQDKEEFFRIARKFTTEVDVVIKLLLSDYKGKVGDQVALLHNIALNGFFSVIEPPQLSFGDLVRLDKSIWHVVPLEFEDFFYYN